MDTGLGPHGTRCSARPIARGRPTRRSTRVLATLSRDDFELRCRARDRAFRDQGITFSLSGEERPFPLDLVPRIIVGRRSGRSSRRACASGSWRSRRFLADVYGAGRDPRRRRRPPPARHQLDALPPGGRRHRAAERRAHPRRRHRPGPRRRRHLPGARGQPAHAVGHLLRGREPADHDARVPGAVRQPPGPPVDDYPPRLLEALRATAPGRRRPTRASSSSRPGVHNSAYFEHSFLARQMGVELVEGRDLVCRDNCVYMRTTDGRAPRRRRLPPHRRRLPRPAPVPARLDARLRRAS